MNSTVIKQVDGVMQLADLTSLDPEKQVLVKRLLDSVASDANQQQKSTIEKYGQDQRPVLS